LALQLARPSPLSLAPVPEPPLGFLQRIQKALSPRSGPNNVPNVYTNTGPVAGGYMGMVNSNTALMRVPGASTYRAYATTPWVFAGINIRTDQLSSAEWDIVPYDNTKRHAARQQDALRELFSQPSAKLDSFQSFAKVVISELLTLDAGPIEKVRYPNGTIAELWPTRGDWIAVDERWDGSDPDRARYYFVPDGTIRATFKNEDMVYLVANQRAVSALGISPMLVLQMVIESELQALEYNRRQVMGAAPDGVLNIGESADAPAVQAAQSKFQSEIFGQGAMAVIGGYKSPSFMKFRDSNRDMQFREWEDLLIRCIAVVLGLAPMDLGITFDVNRSTAEQGAQNTEDRGLRPLMSLFQNFMTREIVWDPSFGGRANNLQFVFKSLNLDESLSKANINKIAMPGIGWKSINEARTMDGRAPIEDPTDANNVFNHILVGTPTGIMDINTGLVLGAQAVADMQTQSKIDVAKAVAEAAPVPTPAPAAPAVPPA
jgi:HK97 family phage portal protein